MGFPCLSLDGEHYLVEDDFCLDGLNFEKVTCAGLR